MPARSPKMNRRIFGFQRRVWCPKCTPASSSSRMVIAATVGPPMVVVAGLRRAAPTEPATPAPPSEASRARRFGVSEGGRLPPGSLPARRLCASRCNAQGLALDIARCNVKGQTPRVAFSAAGSGLLQRFGQFGGQVAGQVDAVAVGRMGEAETGCVQELAAEADLAARDAVQGVAQDRMADCREVHADLVRAARLELQTEQARIRQGLAE